MKKNIYAIFAVFGMFWCLDFLIHGVLLSKAYEETAHLWRPVPEMKTSLAIACTLVFSIIFVSIYNLLAKKNVSCGLKFGLLLGIMHGFGMGFGSYASMPITLTIAFAWFFGSVVQMTLAGLIAGAIIKPE